MSLVDYASSSGEEEDEDTQEKLAEPLTASSETNAAGNGRQEEDAKTEVASPVRPPSLVSRQDQNRVRLGSYAVASGLPSTRPAIQLPDASTLFASPSFSGQSTMGIDHASRVAAAINENTSRKRDTNGFGPQFSRSKHPRGDFSHSRNEPNIPDNLLPPQLRGRSNVVTEDINKLFVNRRAP